MSRPRSWVSIRCAALTCALVVSMLACLDARADFVVNQFDTADEATAWYYENGSSAPATAIWDPTVDSLGNPASGSLKIEIDFDATANHNVATFSRALPTPLDATPAALFIADVLVADESPDTPWGDEGYMQLVGRNGPNWDWVGHEIYKGNIDSDGSWVAIDATPIPDTDLRAFTFQLWGGGPQNLHGRTTVWLDNIQYLGDFPDPSQLGDTDGDRDVDLDDLNNVRNFFGTDQADGDADSDGDTDLDDLNAVRNNFGTGAPQAVPEPGAIALLLTGVVGLLARRQRRHRHRRST